MKAIDILGREIGIGDKIAYAVRSGDTAKLNVLSVEAVTSETGVLKARHQVSNRLVTLYKSAEQAVILLKE